MDSAVIPASTVHAMLPSTVHVVVASTVHVVVASAVVHCVQCV